MSRLQPRSKPNLHLPMQSAACQPHGQWHASKWYFCVPFSRVPPFGLSFPDLCPHVEVSLGKDGVHHRFYRLMAPCDVVSVQTGTRADLWMQTWETWCIHWVILSLNCKDYAVFRARAKKEKNRQKVIFFSSQKYAADGVKRELRDEKEQDGICGVRVETLVGANRPLLTDAAPCPSSTQQQNAFPGSIIK